MENELQNDMNYEIDDLFYFKKNEKGFFIYHLFPKIRERIIENEDIIG